MVLNIFKLFAFFVTPPPKKKKKDFSPLDIKTKTGKVVMNPTGVKCPSLSCFPSASSWHITVILRGAFSAACLTHC